MADLASLDDLFACSVSAPSSFALSRGHFQALVGTLLDFGHARGWLAAQLLVAHGRANGSASAVLWLQEAVSARQAVRCSPGFFLLSFVLRALLEPLSREERQAMDLRMIAKAMFCEETAQGCLKAWLATEPALKSLYRVAITTSNSTTTTTNNNNNSSDTSTSRAKNEIPNIIKSNNNSNEITSNRSDTNNNSTSTNNSNGTSIRTSMTMVENGISKLDRSSDNTCKKNSTSTSDNSMSSCKSSTSKSGNRVFESATLARHVARRLALAAQDTEDIRCWVTTGCIMAARVRGGIDTDIEPLWLQVAVLAATKACGGAGDEYDNVLLLTQVEDALEMAFQRDKAALLLAFSVSDQILFSVLRNLLAIAEMRPSWIEGTTHWLNPSGLFEALIYHFDLETSAFVDILLSSASGGVALLEYFSKFARAAARLGWYLDRPRSDPSVQILRSLSRQLAIPGAFPFSTKYLCASLQRACSQAGVFDHS